MINITQKKHLEEKYGFNLYDDVIFSSNKTVSILFDLNKKPIIAHVIRGDVTEISLPQFEVIEANELLKFIEPNNSLAEVEGKHIFLESVKDHFDNFKDELYLFIPVKRKPTPLWLYVGFRRMIIKGEAFIYANVLRIFEDTPDEIEYYRKTHQDPLTKLFTRESLKKHMDYLENPVNKYLMYMDIDGFKQINDQLGHQVGDQFLIDISNHFISNWERNVLYYRLGGDEFCVYCYDHNKETIIARANQIISDIENLNEIAKSFKISASIGIVEINETNQDYHKLLNLGDHTMYLSKAKGPGNYTFYEE